MADMEPREAVVNAMPIGCSDFRTLRDRGLHFVDKSMFIDRILESGACVTLITCPDGFGKSVNLSMFDAYVNIRYAGEPDRFEGLNISEARPDDPVKNSEHVITMSFEKLCTDDFDAFLSSFKEMVRDIYRGFPELEGSEKLRGPLQERYSERINGEGGYVDFSRSIRYLCEMIEAHYGKDPIVLVDDYDGPVNATAGRKKLQQKIRRFLDHALGLALKDNSHLNYAVVMGFGSLSQSGLYRINNSEIDDAFSGWYGGMFGFTRAEVGEMLEDRGFHGSTDGWLDAQGFEDDMIYRPEYVFAYLGEACRSETHRGGSHTVSVDSHDKLDTFRRPIPSERGRSN